MTTQAPAENNGTADKPAKTKGDKQGITADDWLEAVKYMETSGDWNPGKNKVSEKSSLARKNEAGVSKPALRQHGRDFASGMWVFSHIGRFLHVPYIFEAENRCPGD